MHCPRGAMFIFQVWGIYPHFTGQLVHRYCEDVYILIALHKLPPYLWPMPLSHYEYYTHLTMTWLCTTFSEVFVLVHNTLFEHKWPFLGQNCHISWAWEETSLTHSCNTNTHFTVDWWDATVDCKLAWSPEGGWVSPGSRGWPRPTEISEDNLVHNWSSYFECHKFELSYQSYLEYWGHTLMP